MEYGNGRMTILGRLTAETGVISLTCHGVSHRVEVFENLADPSRNISRAWAGCQAKKLALSDDQAEEILSLGRQYGLVTPGTSLLVLETLEQYLEYNITPPESLTHIREKFLREKSRQKIDEEKQLKSHLDQVASWWEKRIEWWEQDFQSSYLERVEIKKEKRRQRHTMSDVSLEPAGIAYSVRSSIPRQAPPRERILGDFVCRSAEVCENSAPQDSENTNTFELSQSTAATINIQAWTPDTPYLSTMRSAESGQIYAVYLDQRKEYARCPSFFLDCGDYFFKQGQTELAIRILSNLEELQLGDIALLRMYAWRLQQAGRLNMAINVFERIRKIRDDEPQSHRDLALALSDRWQAEGNEADAVRAMTLLYAVISRSWDRFPEIELIALMELNRLIHFAGQADIAAPKCIDSRLIRNLDLDVRISMSWDADLTDVDLHVFEPDGGHAYYAHNRTLIGGLVSKDFTQGYGPEEYILHKAMPGTYIIKAHYYGSHQQTICGPCTVTATVFTNFGRADEQKQIITLRLDKASDQELVGEITIEGTPWVQDGVLQTGRENMLEKFRLLTKGLSINEVKAMVGQPDDIDGDEEIRLLYFTTGRSKVELCFAPKLYAVRHTMAGCTLDIL
jgi:tetratricopeptide (TPR) repeat protein